MNVLRRYCARCRQAEVVAGGAAAGVVCSRQSRQRVEAGAGGRQAGAEVVAGAGAGVRWQAGGRWYVQAGRQVSSRQAEPLFLRGRQWCEVWWQAGSVVQAVVAGGRQVVVGSVGEAGGRCRCRGRQVQV